MTSASRESSGPWRDGRAAEGACLENMFGSHQRGFESHSLRCGLHVRMFESLKIHLARVVDMPSRNLQFEIRGGARVAEWARLLSECRGNLVAGSNPALPATKNAFRKERVFLSGRASPQGIIFKSCPPRHKKTRSARSVFFYLVVRPHRRDNIRIPPSPPQETRLIYWTCFLSRVPTGG